MVRVQGPMWSSEIVTLAEALDEPQIIFYRDPIKCAEALFGNPTFAGEMDYEAMEVFKADGITRIYHEMATGKLWNETQVRHSLAIARNYC